MSLYISTACLKGDVFDVLDAYEEAGFENVELGSSHPYNEKILPAIIGDYNFNFLVHNYFPSPRESFVVNIASQNKTILKRSIDQLKTSIDLCNYLDAPLFTFHSGFRVDPDINLRFGTVNIAPYGAAIKTMVQSLIKLNEYARDSGIKIAIENNVLAAHNLVGGENELFLMCEYWEYERLFDEIDSNNIGILLDLGHLKVTSNTLGFDREEFIHKVRDRVFEVHVHENNGKVDEHRCPKEGDWTLGVIGKRFKDVPITLECRSDDISQLLYNKEKIECLITH